MSISGTVSRTKSGVRLAGLVQTTRGGLLEQGTGTRYIRGSNWVGASCSLSLVHEVQLTALARLLARQLPPYAARVTGEHETVP